uniref:DNA-directed RNA polymerase subunit alpha n=1 Tax=Sciadopitys verticillata TaxID=28979 RepID=G3XHJ0_SCIVE|nr:RNA polymerase alpha chain [Sciadopitys verticillata]AMO00760.1 RNA polymerase alpha chain [Sciadopitys verticillata]BAK86737.1 RNA polymerase alpha chain [Sciadopitys verticillata]BAW34560.1 RNA polymerase alpha chain [Sciadopitys verticillata]BCK60729.1 RNA polymerase alpha chain [Sciadopitys verticillata]
MIKNEISVSIQTPQWKCVESREDSKRLHYGRFTLSPLRKGQANTIGIAMRRALLEEVEGTCITRVKFQNITNEYSAIIGIEESVHDILMNLKEIILRSDVYGIREGSIHIIGPKKVTTQDIILPPSVRIIDTTQHIANIKNSITLDIRVNIEKGRGYIIQNPNHFNSKDGIFPIDAIFMPVRNVNFSIHSYWNGNEIQEMLFLEIWTNGGLVPREALYEASRNLIHLLIPFMRTEEQDIDETDYIPPALLFPGRMKEDVLKDDIFIDQFNLSYRIYKNLKKANINTLSDLLNYSPEDLMKMKYIDKHSIQQILDILRSFGFDLPLNRN